MSLFEANLSAIASRWPATARRIRETADRSGMEMMEITRTRGGEPTARLRREGAAAAYLHSRVAPREEGERRAAAVPPTTGFIVAFGPGLFYTVEALLARHESAVVVVVEPEPAMLRAALAWRDLRACLADERLRLLTADLASLEAAAAYVAQNYLPILHGAFYLEVPRARAEACGGQLRIIAEAAREQVADLAVQRRFGVRWFSNAVRNVATLPSQTVEIPLGETAVVAAAGPSLEEDIAELDGSIPVVSTDTAGPALLQRGIRPAAVVSLDCQQVSYHHLLTAGAEARGIPAVCDLSTAPTVLRASGPAVTTVTAYPLAQLLKHRFPELPSVDGGGGNVTQAAVDFVVGRGVRKIHVVGADFSYPAGHPYARDTYLYRHFRASETRLEPASTRLFELVHADPETRTVIEADGGRTYHTPKLDRYRERFLTAVEKLDAEVLLGPPGATSRPCGASRIHLSSPDGAGPDSSPDSGPDPRAESLRLPPLEKRREALHFYAETLAGLTLPPGPPASALERLEDTVREHWYTLLPLAAAFLDAEIDVRGASATLRSARSWAVEHLRRVLARP